MMLKVVFIYFLYLYTTDALFCQLSTSGDPNLVGSKNYSHCKGDLCLYKTDEGFMGSKTEVYGCLSGFVATLLGCNKEKKHKDSFICFCNHSDYCNTETVDNSTISIIKEIECNRGEIKDGKLLGNETCLGHACTLSIKNFANKTILNGRAGCSNDLLVSMHSNAFGCIFGLQGGMDGSCSCYTDFCNNPSTVITKSEGTIKCVLEDKFGPTIHETMVTENKTCIGEYCLLTKTHRGFTKSCITTAVGTKLNSKKFSHDIARKKETYICNHDWCNVNIETASKT